MTASLEDSIRSLHGIGDVKARAYQRLGVHALEDLLLHFPRTYENRGDIRLLNEAYAFPKAALLLTVATEPRATRLRGRLTLVKFRAFDESGTCEIVFYNQNYLVKTFSVGSCFRFYGHVEKKRNGYVMSSPQFEPWSETAALPDVYPIYPLCEGLTQKQLSKDVLSALAVLSHNGTPDPLPEEIRKRCRLCTLEYALRSIHMPDSFVALAAAKRRLIFDEFFYFALGLSLSAKQKSKNPAPPCPDTDVTPLLRSLPYSLTGAQQRTVDDIARDMKKDTAMSRIVVGDVGCGKTVCAAAAMYIAVKNGKQAALMVPTEILATQHYQDLCALFAPLGIRCELLTSSVSKSKKQKILDALASPDPEFRLPIVIGTQALLADRVTFAEPALVVTDEQHRFGVNQRALLSHKSQHAHVLVMSATPIPRSLALALYGDLDISRIDEMPKGRQRVDTFVVDESYRTRLNGFIRKQVESGGQVYVVCPAVESADTEDGDLSLGQVAEDGSIRQGPPLHTAVDFAKIMQDTFPDLRIAYLHGKMKTAQKDEVMEQFARGELDILVSTTVIEVGVNVPNASLMIVENAERFGLSQLHQLRGRVGRGTRKSYCILVSDSPSNSRAFERLQTMHDTYDGFVIAEKDLAMRGPGDFLRTQSDDAIRQSGGIQFRLADLCDDTGLLHTAFSEARALLDTADGLDAYPLLSSRVHRMFTPNADVLN